jgi:hypothetical protein
MGDLPEELTDLANQEVELLSEDLRRVAPADLPVTIMLYQPLPHPTEPAASRLVDVGPRAAGWPLKHVVQPTSAGETGGFFHTPDYARRFIPHAREITETTRSSFPSGPWARDQVALERHRYPGLRWDADDCPPRGATIHHLSISPPVDDLYSTRLPSLGVVYSLTQSSSVVETVDPVQRLIHASQVVARRALMRRTALLLPELASTLEDFFAGHAIHSHRWSEPFFLAAKFILAHHWFYPSAPAALAVLRRLTANDQCSKLIYMHHRWWPPERDLEPTDSLDSLITQVTGDLLQLGSYCFPGKAASPDAGRFLKAVVTTAFFSLAGEIAVAESSASDFSIDSTRKAQNNDDVFLLPMLDESFDSGVLLAIYNKEKLLDQIRTVTDESRSARLSCLRRIAPNGKRPPGRLIANPEGFVYNVKTNGFAMRVNAFKRRVDSGAQDMAQWMRCRLMELCMGKDNSTGETE